MALTSIASAAEFFFFFFQKHFFPKSCLFPLNLPLTSADSVLEFQEHAWWHHRWWYANLGLNRAVSKTCTMPGTNMKRTLQKITWLHTRTSLSVSVWSSICLVLHISASVSVFLCVHKMDMAWTVRDFSLLSGKTWKKTLRDKCQHCEQQFLKHIYTNNKLIIAMIWTCA